MPVNIIPIIAALLAISSGWYLSKSGKKIIRERPTKTNKMPTIFCMVFT